MAGANYIALKRALDKLSGQSQQQAANERRKQLMAAFVKRTTGVRTEAEEARQAKTLKPKENKKALKKAPPSKKEAAAKKPSKQDKLADQQEIYRLKHQLATARQGLVAQQDAIQQLKQKVLDEQTATAHWQAQYQAAHATMRTIQAANVSRQRTAQSLQDKNRNLSKTVTQQRAANASLQRTLDKTTDQVKSLRGQWIAHNQDTYITAYRLWQQEQSPYRILKEEVIPRLQSQIKGLHTRIQTQQEEMDSLTRAFANEARWRPTAKVAVDIFAPLVTPAQLKEILKIINHDRAKPIVYHHPRAVPVPPRPANIPMTDAVRVKVTSPDKQADTLVKDLLAHTTDTTPTETHSENAAPSKKILHLALDRYSKKSNVRPAKAKTADEPVPLPDWLENPALFQNIDVHILTWQDARGVRSQLKALGANVHVERPDAISLSQIHAIAYGDPAAIIIADRTKAHHATVQAMKDIQADTATAHAAALIADKGIGVTSTLRSIYDILLGRWSRDRPTGESPSE
ncbi:hypothetical protein [Schleiferilactobacillus shenzhenensis]|uniref:Uncharacterized protein n=1 Tax=Schleiferilactobacillus shenzhenensis LY-73 TaxID=1231336 RepID=U4TNY3_9LACO|nr:hypothetical protein [Schleiferilactobacillus shenzhenensis]ERL65155.1 hypothetical protein L248_3093 [Schleiferilactobacillus shenzhenensis LY-73]